MGNVKQLIKDLREKRDWTDASKCMMYEAMMKEASFLIEDMMCENEDLRVENKYLRHELDRARLQSLRNFLH